LETKRKKRNLKDEYEKIYLRWNQAKRDLVGVKSEDLRNVDFVRVCKYTASKSFNNNRSFLLSNGFDYDDLLSMSKFFGACFLGYKDKSEAIDDRRYYYMMTASIFQRLNRFMGWTANKMESHEVYDKVDIEHLESADAQEHIASSPIKVDGVVMFGKEENKSLGVALFEITEELDIMLESNKGKTSKSKKLEAKKREIKREIRIINKKQKNMFSGLREKIKSNPGIYSKRLAYYAHTKHVSGDVRKAARVYCNKYGLDHEKIFNESIKTPDNANNFNL